MTAYKEYIVNDNDNNPDNIVNLVMNGHKKNILIIIIDCLRSDRINNLTRSCKTPSIDEIINYSDSFTQTVSATTSTLSSAGSIFTGLYPFEHGIRGFVYRQMAPDIIPIGQIFNYLGYNTYFDFTGPFAEYGLAKGFHYYSKRKNDYYHNDWGRDIIESLNKDRYQEPWLIILHFWELHRPIYVPKGFQQRKYGKTYYDRALSGLDSYLQKIINHIDDNTIIVITGDHGENILSNMKTTAINKYKQFRTNKKKRNRKVIRKREITTNIKTFKNIGHGYHLYDYLVRVPLIIKSDSTSNSRKYNNQTRTVDILPTLLGLLKIKYPSKMHGVDLLCDNFTSDNLYSYHETYLGTYKEYEVNPNNLWLVGIRSNTHKLIFAPFNKQIKSEMYDLEKDPNEKRNIYNNNQYNNVRLKLLKEISNINEEIINGIHNKGSKIHDSDNEKIINQLKGLGYL